MPLQPAAGARDLNPHQVEHNHQICNQLAATYRLWGYEEVSPPRIERIDTLIAGGTIDRKEIVKLVADETLGLRPEMTASIARAACTRLSQKARPLRLWAAGTVFESKPSFDGSIFIEEELKSGVELLGIKSIAAELELLSLLLQATKKIQTNSINKPKLLIGHTALMEIILRPYKGEIKSKIHKSLTQFNRLELNNLQISHENKEKLFNLLSFRGKPSEVLDKLEEEFGKEQTIIDLRRLFRLLEQQTNCEDIIIQLDPTFQPHFEFYTGIVFQLVCQGISAPIVIASGGRYDSLLKKCGAIEEDAAGVGFTFDVEKIRELKPIVKESNLTRESVLIAFNDNSFLEEAFIRQKEWHKKNKIAIIEFETCNQKEDARKKMLIRDCSELDWIS